MLVYQWNAFTVCIHCTCTFIYQIVTVMVHVSTCAYISCHFILSVPSSLSQPCIFNKLWHLLQTVVMASLVIVIFSISLVGWSSLLLCIFVYVIKKMNHHNMHLYFFFHSKSCLKTLHPLLIVYHLLFSWLLYTKGIIQRTL